MSYINTLVDKVYVINLDKDQERLQRIDTTLRRQGIAYERLSATLGSQVKSDARLTSSCNLFCTDGIKGCAISHHRAWEDMVNNGYSRVLVFEDDALVPDNFDKRVRDVMYKLPDDADIVFLGCRFFCSKDTPFESVGHAVMGTSPQPVDGAIQKVSGSLGAHATLYSLPFVQKIIHEPIETHIDVQLQRWIQRFNAKAYGLHPEIVSTPDPMKDSNLAEKFPPLFNSLLGNIEVTNNISLAWALSENQLKVAGLNLNGLNLLLFGIALLSPLWISILLFVWILIETLVSRDVKTGLRFFFVTALGTAGQLGLQQLKRGMKELKTLALQ